MIESYLYYVSQAGALVHKVVPCVAGWLEFRTMFEPCTQNDVLKMLWMLDDSTNNLSTI
jgi:hypothetical protein